MTKGRHGELLITTRDLREKFDLPNGTFLQQDTVSWEILNDRQIEVIWVRVWTSKEAYELEQTRIRKTRYMEAE